MFSAMPTRMFALALVLVLVGSGCASYSYRAIKPTELPKLEGPAIGPVVSGPGAGSAIAVATRTVETPDGRLIEVQGQFDIVIATRQGTWTFEHPVRARLEDDRLVVQSKNLAPAAIPLAEITRVEVKQFDGKSAANKFLVGTLVGTLVLTVAIFALL